MLVAPFMRRLLPLFPPVVTGSIIMVIGISLMRVGINWAGGGLPTLTKVFDGVKASVPNPAYGQLSGFQIVPILTMCIVMIVVMIESFGMFLAIGEIVGRPVDADAITRGLRADGLGTIVGGVFDTFPYTSFSQNVGLVGVTGVRSRWVTIGGGLIMLALGLVPKTGGAGLVMFGMVAATGAS
jgi:uric acid transporter